MPERNAERKIHIRTGEDLHKRLRIRCAELDTTIQKYFDPYLYLANWGTNVLKLRLPSRRRGMG